MKKTNNKKTRRIAAALAALSMVSAISVPAASICASAADAETETSIIMECDDFDEICAIGEIGEINEAWAALKDSNSGKTTATMHFRGPVADYFNEHKVELKDTLLKAANSKVDEYCDKIPVAGGLLKSVVGKLFGKFMSKSTEAPQMTVNELNENIKQYKAEIEKAISNSKDEIENDILCVGEVQGFYNEFVKFISMIDDYAESIEAISRMDISEEAKTLKIAKLIGNPDDWTKTYTSVFGAYNTSVKMLRQSGLLSTHDIFTAIYDYYAGKSMFSGEAKMQAQNAVDYIHSQFIYSYAVLTECLTAQLEILDMEDTSVLPQMEYNSFSSNIEDVTYRLETLTNQIFGTLDGDAIYDEEGDVVGYENVTATNEFSIEGSYEKFHNINEYLFTNKQTLDKGGKEMSPELLVSKWTDFDYYHMPKYINNQGLSENELLDIVKHANSKGYSIYRYLQHIGFKANIPTDIIKSRTYIPVAYMEPNVDVSKNGLKYVTKYRVKAVLSYRDVEAASTCQELTYLTNTKEWCEDRYHIKKNEDKVDSWFNNAYIMFLQKAN